MPTYEFRCPEGHDFEKFYRSISGAESQAACPVCGKPGVRRMSASGFAFKGSGFYLTDYGKNAHRTSGSDTSATASGAESSSSESGDKKSSDASSGSTPAPAPTESKPAPAPSKPTKPSKPSKPSTNE